MNPMDGCQRLLGQAIVVLVVIMLIVSLVITSLPSPAF